MLSATVIGGVGEGEGRSGWAGVGDAAPAHAANDNAPASARPLTRVRGEIKRLLYSADMVQ